MLPPTGTQAREDVEIAALVGALAHWVMNDPDSILSPRSKEMLERIGLAQMETAMKHGVDDPNELADLARNLFDQAAANGEPA